MFTGIVQAVGTIEALTPLQGEMRGGVRLAVEAGGLELSDVQIGDSISAQMTVGGTPSIMSRGVIKNPPPTPNRPERKPTMPPSPTMASKLMEFPAMGRYTYTLALPAREGALYGVGRSREAHRERRPLAGRTA